jgi:hypothetical protein
MEKDSEILGTKVKNKTLNPTIFGQIQGFCLF